MKKTATNGTDLGMYLRAALEALFAFRPDAAAATSLQFGFGRPLDPHEPNPQEFEIMTMGNVGQRIPLIVKATRADGAPGEIVGEPSLEVEDAAIAEVREVDGQSFAYLLMQGGTSISAFAKTPSGGQLQAVGLIVVNDPADDATILELELGPAEDAPAA